MSVDELETIVASLSPNDLSRFSEWFENFMADKWDQQIEQDIKAGRLDAAIRRADDHFDQGRCTPL